MVCSKTLKKVAVKFCGGCNPDFDRVHYLDLIRSGANDAIYWVQVEGESSFDFVLFVNGCPVCCCEKDIDLIDSVKHCRRISISDAGTTPEKLIRIILECEV